MIKMKHRGISIQTYQDDITKFWYATAKHPKEKGASLKSHADYPTQEAAQKYMCGVLDAILDQCSACAGEGKVYRWLGDQSPQKCNWCNGTGNIKNVQQMTF
jgi:DnaJ-class molecular chaperone